MTDTVIVFLGGGVGASLRYGLGGAVHRILGADFPYGTLVVNLLGCFFIGALMTVFEDRFIVQARLRLFLTIGLLGGFTTFSTFSFETVALLREGSVWLGFSNIASSFVGCLGATWIGVMAGKVL